METLPPEMVEKVCLHLTPQDLAYCSAVSHKWREIFNQDWLWKPHCDPELEEPLRTTPPVVEPMFVTPEGENSTLSRISKWRLAFMREKHLWSNLEKNRFLSHSLRSENDAKSQKRSFLSNNLLVNWFPNIIQIWDISKVPAAIVVESDSSVNIEGWCNCSVLDSNTLLVEKNTSFQVYLVDIRTKSIKLKHDISLEAPRKCGKIDFAVKEQVSFDGSVITLGVTACELELVIYDLGKGKKIIKEPFPMVGNKDGNVGIHEIKTSLLSDDVLVTLSVNSKHYFILYYFIYSLEQHLFLPGPVATSSYFRDISAINKHYIAILTPLYCSLKCELLSMKIINYHTSEVIFENEDLIDDDVYPKAYKDFFIFVELVGNKRFLKMFSLTNKTITTVFEYGFYDVRYYLDGDSLIVVNNTFVVLTDIILSFTEDGKEFNCSENEIHEVVLGPSGQSLKRVGWSLSWNDVINKAYTRKFFTLTDDDSDIYYYW